MKTVTKTAFANLKQNKGRNILAGVAIALTTLLIYTILTVGFGTIKLQAGAINKIYPTWHIMYRDVKQDKVQALKKHADIEALGERSDIAQVEINNSTILLIYLDRMGYQLNHLEVMKGHIPVKADEIAVSKKTLKVLELNAQIGDTIEIPYQIYDSDGIGKEQKSKFKISAILADGDSDNQQKLYSILVSKAFLDGQVSAKEQSYRIMYRVAGADHMTTKEIEQKGNTIAGNFGILEGNVVVNNDYLWANYTDPNFYTGIAVIILIIILAGYLTIYGIYYVSMVHKVQEYGKLKALGATSHQIRQIVFREGMLVTCAYVPFGLLIGLVFSYNFFQFFLKSASMTSKVPEVMMELLKEGKINLFDLRIVPAAVALSFITVAISIRKPMRIAGKISAIEAMRYENGPKTKNKNRKGYMNLNLFRLTKTNLLRNKKRTVITIVTLGMTGILFFVAATVLNCAKPSEMAKEDILADYRISIKSESDNEMHPERDWKNIQQNNPLDQSFEQKLLSMNGVSKVHKTQSVFIKLDDFLYDNEPSSSSIIGLGEEFAGTLEAGIIEGTVTYKELLKGDKILISKSFMHWFPNTKVGDEINITIEDGNKTIHKAFEIAAICDCSYSITQGTDFILPTKAIEELCKNNMTYTYEIAVDKDSEIVEKELKALTDSSGFLELSSYKEHLKMFETTMSIMSKAGYAIIIILAGIGVMNLINTMINSVYTRKRELGIMQAIGMSDRQLIRMLQLEGLFYTIGTLFISLGLGSTAGYLVFLYAKNNNMMNITRFHYPYLQAFLLIIVVFIIQMILTVLISRNFNKQSLIDRVKLSE